jgi:tetratricopeptide (TPR) repeat protein
MALSEIEKLERRYAENPQGLTFAPLAEIHRKNGEAQRALDLLSSGLEHHPNYIPASIVLGRCHMDLGDVQKAESAFLHVLALDGENVIALKALADISERLLRFDEAERWLNTLLTVDRSNDEAREQLQRVEISRRQAEVATSAEPSSADESSGADRSSGADQSSIVAEVPPDGDGPRSPFEPPVAEPAVGWVSPLSGHTAAPPPIDLDDLEPSALRDRFDPPDGIEFRDLAALESDEPVADHREVPASLDETSSLDSVEPLAGLVGREVDTPEEEALGDLMFETGDDIFLESAGGSEFQMPDASQELSGSGARGERAPFEEDAVVPPSAAWDTPSEERSPPAQQEDEEAPAPFAPEPYARESYGPASFEPEPFLHEPPQANSSSAAYGMEPPAPMPPAPTPSPPEPTAPDPPAAPPQRAYGAEKTGGRSVAQLFKGMLSARPPAQASAAPVRQAAAPGSPGAPTRPATDALSLSSVFGEEGSETPPAVPTSSPGAGSVSFDDFFSSSSASPASRTPRPPDPKTDDLDQFHAWLQNLKR